MAVNTAPIFSKIGIISGSAVGYVSAQSSSGAGIIGTNIFQVFTADPTNGSFVQRLRLNPFASGGALTTTTAAVHRIYVSSVTGSGTVTTPANTWLFQEASAAAQTTSQTATAVSYIEIPLNFALPPGYSILVNSSLSSSAYISWSAMVFGGNY
jgi:hypothetical protein